MKEKLFNQKKHYNRGQNDADNVVYGRNAVLEALKSGKLPDKLLIASGSREGSISLIIAKAVELGVPVIESDRRKLDMYGENHQGAVAILPVREYVELEDILRIAEEKNEPPFIVILDHINDPHNFGAVLRTAECAGVHGVIIPKRNSVTLNATAAKASAGACEYVPVCRVPNIAAVIDELKKKNIWIYAAEASGGSIYNTGLKGAAAFVFGSEESGISRLVTEKSDYKVSIPLKGKINSLNVSAAAAVVLYEALRQRTD